MIGFGLGFLLGVLAVIGLEVWIVLLVVDRLHRRSPEPRKTGDQTVRDLDGEQSLAAMSSKQGMVWVLEPEKVPKLNTDESPTKGSKEQKNKKNIVEVCPIKKYAKIKDRALILSDLDGSQRTVKLSDYTVVAVSASDLCTRKWAKRYPIRLESRNSVLHNGNKTFYMYFETSWEKESWCKALRFAACPDRDKLNWFTQLSKEFHDYFMSLNAEYPSFLKPAALHEETSDRTNKIDVSSSRVRGFLKKLAKKASKNGVENKSVLVSSSNRGVRRIGEIIPSLHDVSSVDGSGKFSSEKSSNNSLPDLVQPSSPTSSKSQQITPDSVCSDKMLGDDEGTLCWNLLFARLFFDAKRSIGLNEAIKTRIQRTLSNMRTPSYIGGVTCTGLDLGNLPPLIHKMRVLPVDLNEVWAMEVDIEYSGGIVLDVETRIEVCEQELQKGNLGLSSTGEAASDLIEGVDFHGDQLVFPSNSADQMENRDERDRVDGLKHKNSTKWASNYASRWKAAVHSFANKVAQVPLALAIRIASLRGTLRFHIKPPPSDQLWFGFTSMPEIEWNLDSSVGDQKITSSHIAMLIGNRFKASIREMLVLPNCENICIPWMLAEKDDWAPRHVAPFIFVNQEAMDLTGLDSTSLLATGPKPVLDGSSTKSQADATISRPDDKILKITDAVDAQQPSEKSETTATGSVSTNQSFDRSKSEELREPLLKTDENVDGHGQNRGESPKTSTSSGENLILDKQIIRSMPWEEEDAKPKKIGSRRARMMDIGKKMGEKLEEKRRLLEERGRHVVEKMQAHNASKN